MLQRPTQVQCPNCSHTGDPEQLGADCPNCPGWGLIDAALAADPARDWLLGRTLDDHYVLLRKLGQGGFGAVFLAREKGHHDISARQVAIKVHLSDGLVEDEEIWHQWGREIAALSKLRSPHTVTLYTSGTDKNLSVPYLVFEYVHGHTLEKALEDPNAWSWPRIAHIIDHVLLSLIEAHDSGIIHRDLKPANIMLTLLDEDPDFVKVVDFGIARLLAHVTRSHRFTGTPVYGSPEQSSNPDKIDGRSDLYAVGVILWELTTGAPPFTGTSPIQALMAHLNDPLPPFRPRLTAPDQLHPLLLRVLSKDPGDRFPDARAMRSALQHLSNPYPTPEDLDRPRPINLSRRTRDTLQELDPTKQPPVALPPIDYRQTLNEGSEALRASDLRRAVSDAKAASAAASAAASNPLAADVAMASTLPQHPQLTPQPPLFIPQPPLVAPTPPQPQLPDAIPQPSQPLPPSPSNAGCFMWAVALVGLPVLIVVVALVAGTAAYLLWPKDVKPDDDDRDTPELVKPDKKATGEEQSKSPRALCDGGDHTACLLEAGELYRASKYKDALIKVYAAPQPFWPERDSAALAAQVEPAWGTRQRFDCAPRPAPCDVWAFWQADRGGPDAAEATNALEMRCGDGVADACHRLGLVLEDRKNKPAQAMEAYRKAWESNVVSASTAYGYLLHQSNASAGLGVLGDGCNLGNLRACWALGMIRHQDGDLPAAKQLFKTACKDNKGDLGGCAWYARILFFDERDFKAARPWYQRACDRGNQDACVGLAEGLDKEKNDWDGARSLLKRACTEGYGYACWRYVIGHRDHDRKLKDQFEKKYLKLACKYGYEEGCKGL